MEIVKRNENGNFIITSKAIENIAEIACLKNDEVVVNKKGNFVKCTSIDNNIEVEIQIKIKKGCDIDLICRKLQKLVRQSVYETAEIKLANVNINILGFVD